jgi:hypothetical protein
LVRIIGGEVKLIQMDEGEKEGTRMWWQAEAKFKEGEKREEGRDLWTMSVALELTPRVSNLHLHMRRGQPRVRLCAYVFMTAGGKERDSAGVWGMIQSKSRDQWASLYSERSRGKYTLLPGIKMELSNAWPRLTCPVKYKIG